MAKQISSSMRPNFFIVMLLLISLGVWLMSTDVLSLIPGVRLPSDSILVVIQHSFGEALAIAAILGLTVDSFVKRKFAREVASDVSIYMASNQLPLGVQEELASLSKQQVFRDDFRIEWCIDHETGSDTILLTTTVRYRLVNVMDDKYKFEHAVATGRQYVGDTDTRRIIYAEGPGYKEIAKEGKSLGKLNGGSRVYSKAVDVPGKSNKYFCATIEELAPSSDSDTVILSNSARNISVQVLSPPHIAAEVIVAHRKREDFKPSGDDKNATWSFGSRDVAMLPTQSIKLAWKPREVEDQAGPTTG